MVKLECPVPLPQPGLRDPRPRRHPLCYLPGGRSPFLRCFRNTAHEPQLTLAHALSLWGDLRHKGQTGLACRGARCGSGAGCPALGPEPAPGDQEGTEACPPNAGSRHIDHGVLRAQPARGGCGRRRAELGRERASRSLRRCGGLESTQRLGNIQGCPGFLFKGPTHHPEPGARSAVQRRGCVPGCAQSSEPGAAAGARGDLTRPGAASASPSAQWGHGQHPPPGDPAWTQQVAVSSRPQETHRLTEDSFLYPPFSCKKPPRAGAQPGMTVGGWLPATGHACAQGCTDAAPR